MKNDILKFIKLFSFTTIVFIFSFFLFLFKPEIAIAQSVGCPEGYTCPDTSYKPVLGEVLEKQETVTRGNSPNFSGETGVKANNLIFPDLADENEYFDDEDMFRRSLPFDAGIPEFKPADLTGYIGHSGCGQVTVNNNPVGPAKIKQGLTKNNEIPLTESYNNLLTVLRFWEGQYVSGRATTLKIATVQPENIPTNEEHRENCNDTAGGHSDAIQINNLAPANANILEDILSSISIALSNFFKSVGLNPEISATAKIQIQQEKYFPGEQAFESQANNFLNSFISYDDLGKFTNNQEENVEYHVLGSEQRTEKINYSGMKAFQDKSLDLVKSLRPYEEAKLITTLSPGGTLPAPPVPIPGLYYTIPHKDKSVPITADRKDITIKMAKIAWPDTKIEEFWDLVVNAANNANINPALAIAIWIEESGASSPTADKGLGPAYSDFGCFPSGNPDDFVSFDRSLNCFLETAKNTADFAGFVKTYCGPNVEPVCDNNRNFINHLKSWYDTLVPSGHGAAQPQ